MSALCLLIFLFNKESGQYLLIKNQRKELKIILKKCTVAKWNEKLKLTDPFKAVKMLEWHQLLVATDVVF